MKTRSLPEIDLARIAVLPSREEKRAALELLVNSYPQGTYFPWRMSLLDIMNIEPGPLGAGHRTPLHIIEKNIRAKSSGPDQIAANLAAARGLYRFVTKHSVHGKRHEFTSLPIGIPEKVIYWMPAVIAIDGIPTLPFVDPRRTHGLSPATSRLFTFSAQRQAMAAYDDFRSIRLGIIRFRGLIEETREAVLYTDEGLELFDLKALQAMVKETYEIWYEVLAASIAKKRDSGGKGGLGL